MKLRLVITACVGLALCSPLAGQAPAGRETLAQKAGKLYGSAISQYNLRAWDQAEPLLEKFIKLYSTHDHAAVARMQLAYCRAQLKDHEGYEKALNEVIKKYPTSPAWYVSYGSLLGRAKSLKDHDKYLDLLEAMLKGLKEAPLSMHGSIGRHFGDYFNHEYGVAHAFTPYASWMASVHPRPGWVMDMVTVADTPERAQRALAALEKTFKARKGELPPDWQFARVALLRKAGKGEQARMLFDEYVKQWGDDPRAMDLWLLEITRGPTAKDAAKVDAAFGRLLKTYGGVGALEEPIRHRLYALQGASSYDQFATLARGYLKAYEGSDAWDHIVGWWVSLAERLAAKGDTSRIPDTLKMLDELPDNDSLARQRSILYRKFALHVRLEDFDKAVEIARELTGEKHWCAAAYNHVRKHASLNKVFIKVEDEARAKWKIPRVNPASKAFAMLHKLKARLSDDQIRHAEELAEEMFAKHRDDASTIEAVKLMADYCFKKALHEPRDKWMARMVNVYHFHPLTQEVLAKQIISQNAARRYDRLAKAIDTAVKRFPGTAWPWGWYRMRLHCYNAAKDAEGARRLNRTYYGARAEAGEIRAIRQLAAQEMAVHGKDNRAIGDAWAAKARKFAGRPQELYCLGQAWSAYYWSPYRHHAYDRKVQWNNGLAVNKQLQEQELAPELRWKLAFADVNLLAHKADARAMMAAMDERLTEKRYRDLSLRLDMPAIGSALGKAKAGKAGIDLAKKFEKLCFTRRDAAAIELMLAAMFAAGEAHAPAAQHYLNAVYAHPQPARMYHYARSAMGHLRQASQQAYARELGRYVRKVNRVQELVPRLLYDLGYYYVGRRSAAVMGVRKQLAGRFAASGYLDRLDRDIAKLRR